MIQQLYIKQIAVPGSKIEIVFEPKAKIQTVLDGKIEEKIVTMGDIR